MENVHRILSYAINLAIDLPQRYVMPRRTEKYLQMANMGMQRVSTKRNWLSKTNVLLARCIAVPVRKLCPFMATHCAVSFMMSKCSAVNPSGVLTCRCMAPSLSRSKYQLFRISIFAILVDGEMKRTARTAESGI